MRAKVLNHEIVIKTYSQDTEHHKKGDIAPILEMSCINCEWQYQTVILTDIEQLTTPKQIQKAIKTVTFAMNKIHREKVQKKKEMKAEFKQFKEIQKALANTKHDEESFNKALTEYYDNLKN